MDARLREKILIRDPICVCCIYSCLKDTNHPLRRSVEVAHVLWKSQRSRRSKKKVMGVDDERNLVGSCHECNFTKKTDTRGFRKFFWWYVSDYLGLDVKSWYEQLPVPKECKERYDECD